MGFNIPLFKTMGRSWGRGSPPPRGSIEWAGVADMWEPEPPRSSSGFQVFEIGFTELDAADRWMKRLYENIRYGRLDATKEEIIEASKFAYAHDFVLAQPDGYETIVGDKRASELAVPTYRDPWKFPKQYLQA